MSHAAQEYPRTRINKKGIEMQNDIAKPKRGKQPKLIFSRG